MTTVEQSQVKSEYPVRKVEVEYDVESIGSRYQRIYTGLVYDAMESIGLRGRAMNSGVYPLLHTMKVAGPAFTMHGIATPSQDVHTHKDRKSTRLNSSH